MSTWGKLAGASAGYFIGGIIGAVVVLLQDIM